MARKPDTTTGWNAQRRAALYRVLLREVVAFIYAYQIEQGDYSSIKLEETAAALVVRVERALDAEARGDNEAIRKMLAEIGGAQALTDS